MLNARHQRGIVFYDGVCGLCDRWIRLIVKGDVHQSILFAPLQGETARNRSDLPTDIHTVVLVLQPDPATEAVYSRSDAALLLLDHIGGGWRIVSWLRIIPRGIRDAVYDFVARHRYAWFGKFDSCPTPPPQWQNRFLP